MHTWNNLIQTTRQAFVNFIHSFRQLHLFIPSTSRDGYEEETHSDTDEVDVVDEMEGSK